MITTKGGRKLEIPSNVVSGDLAYDFFGMLNSLEWWLENYRKLERYINLGTSEALPFDMEVINLLRMKYADEIKKAIARHQDD